jgi:hypothetical protein
MERKEHSTMMGCAKVVPGKSEPKQAPQTLEEVKLEELAFTDLQKKIAVDENDFNQH